MALTFTLKFVCENAVFDEEGIATEIERILTRTATGVLVGDDFGRVRDSNGNRVGWWFLREESE